MNNDDFYTLRGYNRMEDPDLSAAMEDYLEMICRVMNKGKYVRVKELAALLNVTPPSASKMIVKLKERGVVEFEPYGIVQLTDKGRNVGKYLLRRHEILHRFFCHINDSQNELELVEKIEHFMDERTVSNIEKMMKDLDIEKPEKP